MSLHDINAKLLKQNYDLNIHVPSEALVPFMDNRRNYISFLENIYDIISHKDCRQLIPNEIHCIDIGTGYSAIYPLLGCKCRPEWKWFATELDQEALSYAEKNIQRNNFQDKIELIKVTDPFQLFPLLNKSSRYNETAPFITFVVCNPPFYQNEQEYQTSIQTKKPLKFHVSGTVTERFTHGGELEFCKRMILDSRDNDILICTCMIGKKSNLMILLNFLASIRIHWFTFHTLRQGMTWRWIIAWSHVNTLKLFCDLDKEEYHTLLSHTSRSKYIQWIHLRHHDSITIYSIIEYLVKELHCDISEQHEYYLYKNCNIKVDSWSRKSRRSKKQKSDPLMLCFSMSVASSCHLYLELKDYSLWNSFISLLNHLRSRFSKEIID